MGPCLAHTKKKPLYFYRGFMLLRPPIILTS